jgi:hypothetical protein
MTQKNIHIYPAAGVSHSLAQESVLKTLAYFDVFHYPLTRDEIQIFANISLTSAQMNETLTALQEQNRIFLQDELYSLQNNPLLIHRRRQGNNRAEALLKKAVGIGRFLYQFPFVRAVGISGSLSKNFAEQKGDIDFFIITKANRLWIARTIMHLYKKLTFITGRQHFYCMNYYIDETALTLEDQNIFTAMELKTLLPVAGEKTMQEFIAANTWANEWLPVCTYRTQQIKDRRISFLKRIGEWLFAGKVGSRLDNYLMNTTARRWKKKELDGKKNSKGLTMGLITGKHFAKSNPGDFQQKVLSMYEQRVASIIQKESTALFRASSAK